MLTSDDLAFFLVLARSGSLADGARKLDVSPPAVTQRLKALERRIGARLIERSGRRLSLTDEGELVAARAASVADIMDDLAEALADRRAAVTGHLRVAAPHGFGRLHVAPVVSDFARLHPNVTVTLELSDHPAARLVDSFDVVIHIGLLGPLGHTMTVLAANRRLLCASPAYLGSAPPLRAPADLVRHRCLVVRENDEDVTLWRFHNPLQESATVRIRPALSSNDGAVVRDWTIAGHGVAVRSEWDVAIDLAAGRLLRPLPDWQAPSADIVALVGPRRSRSARATAFLARLRQSLASPAWLSDGGASAGP